MNPLALITGGQQGIGLGVALALKDAGFRIALAAQLPPDAAPVRAALEALGGAGRYWQHDMQTIEAVPALLTDIEAAMGPIDTLVSNAGVPAKVRGDMLDMQPDSWDLVLGVNLRGAFFLAQAVARRMLETQATHYRSMHFVTSVNAEMVSIERAEYCISKTGASMMTKLFAARLAPHGIGVFELRPGIIETGMTAVVHDKYTDMINSGHVPAGRWGLPADIGVAVVPLAQGQMAFSSGAVIPVDGGLSVHRL